MCRNACSGGSVQLMPEKLRGKRIAGGQTSYRTGVGAKGHMCVDSRSVLGERSSDKGGKTRLSIIKPGEEVKDLRNFSDAVLG